MLTELLPSDQTISKNCRTDDGNIILNRQVSTEPDFIVATHVRRLPKISRFPRFLGVSNGRYWTRTSDLHDVNVAL